MSVFTKVPELQDIALISIYVWTSRLTWNKHALTAIPIHAHV